MTSLLIEFISGIQLGIEHCSGDLDDDWNWVIAVNLLVIRLVIMNHKLEEK